WNCGTRRTGSARWGRRARAHRRAATGARPPRAPDPGMTPGSDDLSHLHRPVLVAEVLTHLAPRGPIGGLVVDGTVGYAGHAVAMLTAWPAARLLGCDRDRDALVAAKARLAQFPGRARLFHASYADLDEVLAEAGERTPEAVLLDVGA